MPHPHALARIHRGALALLSTCRQLRHEASSTFHTMAVFDISTFVLDDIKEGNICLNLEPWNSIQSIQMPGYEVERWCYFADIYNGESLGKLFGEHMYTGFFPSLKHVLAVYCIDEGEPCSQFSDHEIADTLKLAFGKKDLRIHIQVKFQGSVFGYMALDLSRCREVRKFFLVKQMRRHVHCPNLVVAEHPILPSFSLAHANVDRLDRIKHLD